MRITVLGAGSWGTALACLLARNGHQVKLWNRTEEKAAQLRHDRENKLFLPGIELPAEMEIGSGYELTSGIDYLIFAVPSNAVPENADAIVPYIDPGTVIVNVAKGFAPNSQKRLSEVIRELIPGHPVLTLSGPSHAEEVALNLPTTVVIAGDDAALLQEAQDVFMNDSFRVYQNTDQIGVEVGGAVKNIIALGAGILEGLELGDNARAALMTRGLAETKRLGVAMGAKAETFSGLAGLGDLIVTCTSTHSRNFRAGWEIGRGKPWHQVVEETSMVVEGVYATQATYKLAQKHQVVMPITEQLYKSLYENGSLQEAMRALMTRAKTAEE